MFEESFIRTEFARSGTPFKEDHKNFKVCCFNQHMNPKTGELKWDTKYKLEVTKDGQKAHCWVCKWGGSWDKMAPHYGMETLRGRGVGGLPPGMEPPDVFGNLSKTLHVEHEMRRVLPEHEELPVDFSWSWNDDGGFEHILYGEFIRQVPCYLWNEEVSLPSGAHFFVQRLLMPVYMFGSLVGFSGRRLDGRSIMKHYNAPWTDNRRALFPFDFVRKQKPSYVVLVEGQKDCLRLLQAGIPALALQGAGTFNQSKLESILAMGVAKIATCMDGDATGYRSARQIEQMAGDYFDQVLVIDLPEGLDPGNFRPEHMEWTKQTLSAL